MRSSASISWLSLIVAFSSGAGAAPLHEHGPVHLRPHKASAGPLKAEVKPAPQVLARRNDRPLLSSSPRIQASGAHAIHPALVDVDASKLTAPRHVLLEARRSSGSQYYGNDESSGGVSGYGNQFGATGGGSVDPYGSSGYGSSSDAAGYGSGSSSPSSSGYGQSYADQSYGSDYGSSSAPQSGYGSQTNSLYSGQQQQSSPYAGQSYNDGSFAPGQQASGYGSQQQSSGYAPQQQSPGYTPQQQSPGYAPQQQTSNYGAQPNQAYAPPQQNAGYGASNGYAPDQSSPRNARAATGDSEPETTPTKYTSKASNRKTGHFAASNDAMAADGTEPVAPKKSKKKSKHQAAERGLPLDDDTQMNNSQDPTANKPSAPSGPDAPSKPDAPTQPDAPNKPDAPYQPDAPTKPDAPAAPDSGNAPAPATPTASRPQTHRKQKWSSVKNAVATSRPSVNGNDDSGYDDDSARGSDDDESAAGSDEERVNADCDALQTIYNDMGGASWSQANGWIAGGSCCTAFGVTCTDGRVTALDLGFNNLSGNMSGAVFDLDQLERINMTNNAISGPLPNSFGTLGSIDTLLLSDNQLSGDMPQSLIDSSMLHRVDLSNNAFTGKLTFSGASSLDQLIAAHNQFSAIDFSNTPSLSKVVLDDNPIAGALPKSDDVPVLTTWSSARCNFTGPAFDMAKLSSMTHFNVQRNRLTGPFPDATAVPNLQYFAINGNQFAGVFPDGKAPRYLTTCYVDAVPTASCPSQTVMDDPNSLASKCNLACRGGGAMVAPGSPNAARAPAPDQHLGLVTSSRPSGAIMTSSNMLYVAVGSLLSVFLIV